MRHQFRSPEERVVSQDETYEIRVTDLGQTLSLRVPEENLEVALTSVRPQQSNKLLYHVDQLATASCSFEGAPA